MAIIDASVARMSAETLGQRVRRRRLELGLTQVQLSDQAGINQGYLSQIEKGNRKPGAQALQALAVALDLPPAILVGSGADHDNPQPLDVRHIPLFGAIPAGAPAQSQEQLELFPVLRHMWTPDHYCLRLTFDSMEPTLKPGDIVLVHYRPGVEPELVQGRICACLVDGEPTLKRITVTTRGGERVVILHGDNPAREPWIIDASRDFSIQGVVTTLVSRVL